MFALMLFGFSAPLLTAAETTIFEDDFKNGLGKGWKWVREDPKAWRTTADGLEIRVLPGNMWGPPNNAKNVLVRPIPASGTDRTELSVKVHNKPTEQYEQVDLVWYYDDSHMVKIGLEQVDGKLCVVMGREEKDRTRTLAKIPKGTPSIHLSLSVEADKIEGHYRPEGGKDWIKAGECNLPTPADGKAHASLQVYQGPRKVERWAKITDFQIRRIGPTK